MLSLQTWRNPSALAEDLLLLLLVFVWAERGLGLRLRFGRSGTEEVKDGTSDTGWLYGWFGS